MRKYKQQTKNEDLCAQYFIQVSHTRACLAIRKHADIVAIQDTFHQRLDLGVHIMLRRRLPKRPVKLKNGIVEALVRAAPGGGRDGAARARDGNVLFV
jgi:hypothetical protein